MTSNADPGQAAGVAPAADGDANGRDPRWNLTWLEDQQAHAEVLADCLHRPLTPPRPQVAAVMGDVVRGDHNDRVEELLGDMLRTTSRRLSADRPDLRDLVYRAVAEELVEPDSVWHNETLDHLEVRTRPLSVLDAAGG